MKRWADWMVVIGATIATGGGGYVVVLGHVARSNRGAALVAVFIAMLGAAILATGIVSRGRE
jgi:hypothetical protein